MSVMNKKEVISNVAEKTGQSKALIGRVIDAMEEEVFQALSDGREVKLSGFLAFEKTVRSARKLKNPITGEDMDVPAQNAVRVRPMSRLRDSVVSDG